MTEEELKYRVAYLEAENRWLRAEQKECPRTKLSWQHDGSDCRAWNNPRENWCDVCIEQDAAWHAYNMFLETEAG